MTREDSAVPITLGVEEELFLVDPGSRDLVRDPDPAVIAECQRNAAAHKVVPEFFRAQIETNSRVCESVAQVRQALLETRGLVIDAAERHGCAVMAASTHPFAAWDTQLTTPKERYERFAVSFQDSLRRFVAGGMHVHAGFGDADSRIRVLTAIRRYLPLLHALSTSSPFFVGRLTGFKSHRMNLFGALHRTGLPRALGSEAEYEDLVREYQRMAFIEDASEIWWDIRPSKAYPTVEMRICDTCTRIDDAVSLVALYASLIRWLSRQDAAGELPPEPPTELIGENRWLAQRYGVLAFFGDMRGGGRLDIADEAERLVEELGDDADALECAAELRHVLSIISDGSGADRQVDHYRLRRLEGDTDDEALRSVVDLVIAETREGVK
ncbi:MAG: carboxylate-amine ligase [Gammaproteobacteria bacterium]|nr:carboxylate-amine ligase [Gammaproteobacteria bacterium]